MEERGERVEKVNGFLGLTGDGEVAHEGKEGGLVEAAGHEAELEEERGDGGESPGPGEAAEDGSVGGVVVGEAGVKVGGGVEEVEGALRVGFGGDEVDKLGVGDVAAGPGGWRRRRGRGVVAERGYPGEQMGVAGGASHLFGGSSHRQRCRHGVERVD